MRIEVNLISINSDGTMNAILTSVRTNHRGWFVLEGPENLVATSLEKLAMSVNKKMGKYMMVACR